MDSFTKQILDIFKTRKITVNGILSTPVFETELLSLKITDVTKIRNAISYLNKEKYIEIIPTGFILLQKGYDYFYKWINLDMVLMELMDVFKINRINESEYLPIQKLQDEITTWSQGFIDKLNEAIRFAVSLKYIEEIEHGYRLLRRGKYHIDNSL